MENTITRKEACDLIREILWQVEEGNEKITLPSYTLKNNNDPIGIKNVNFSSECAYNENDSRYEKFKQQRLEQGFDNTELWSLDYTILRFIKPRLEAFINGVADHGYPGNVDSEDEWKNILNEMLFAIDYYISNDKPEWEEDENHQYKRDEQCNLIPTAEANRAKEGWKLFVEHFFSLWD